MSATACSRCLEHHSKEACTANSPICPACEGPHEVTVANCPTWKKEKEAAFNIIKATMTNTTMTTTFSAPPKDPTTAPSVSATATPSTTSPSQDTAVAPPVSTTTTSSTPPDQDTSLPHQVTTSQATTHASTEATPPPQDPVVQQLNPPTPSNTTRTTSADSFRR